MTIMKISPRFYNPKFWRIVKCVIFFLVFLHLLIQSAGSIPEGKSVFFTILWSIGVIMELVFLAGALKMKPVEITEEYIAVKKGQILAGIKRWLFCGLLLIVFVPLFLLLEGNPMALKDFLIMAGSVIIAALLVSVLSSLGSDLFQKEEGNNEE